MHACMKGVHGRIKFRSVYSSIGIGAFYGYSGISFVGRLALAANRSMSHLEFDVLWSEYLEFYLILFYRIEKGHSQ